MPQTPPEPAATVIDAASRPAAALPAGSPPSADPPRPPPGDTAAAPPAAGSADGRVCATEGCTNPVGSSDVRVKHCPDHRGDSHKRKAPAASPASGRVTVGKPPRGGRESEEDRKAREDLAKAKLEAAKRAEIATWLQVEANPAVVLGARRLLGIPTAWLDGPNGDGIVLTAMTADGPQQLWQPSLRTQLSFSVKETEAMANIAVRLESTNQGKFISAWLHTFAPYFAIGASLYTVGKVAVRFTALRVQVVQVQGMMAQAEAANDPTAQMAAAQAAQAAAANNGGAAVSPESLARMMADLAGETAA